MVSSRNERDSNGKAGDCPWTVGIADVGVKESVKDTGRLTSRPQKCQMDSSCYIKMYRRLVISSSWRHGHTVGTHVAFGRSLYSVRDFAYRLLRDTSHNTTALDIFENIIFFLSVYYCIEHVRGFGDYALYKSTFYLLTYLFTVRKMARQIRTVKCQVERCGKNEWK